jgi:hypothetical protein
MLAEDDKIGPLPTLLPFARSLIWGQFRSSEKIRAFTFSEVCLVGILRRSQAPLVGGEVLPEHILVPGTDRGVRMDEFPLTVLLMEDGSITERYLRAIG